MPPEVQSRLRGRPCASSYGRLTYVRTRAWVGTRSTASLLFLPPSRTRWNASLPEIPKGLNLSAQGCEERALPILKVLTESHFHRPKPLTARKPSQNLLASKSKSCSCSCSCSCSPAGSPRKAQAGRAAPLRAHSMLPMAPRPGVGPQALTFLAYAPSIQCSPHRIHTVTTPSPHRSTSNSLLEVLRCGHGEATGRLRRDSGGRVGPLRGASVNCGNIQHPTSNVQHAMTATAAPIGCWMLDVGCWMLPIPSTGVPLAPQPSLREFAARCVRLTPGRGPFRAKKRRFGPYFAWHRACCLYGRPSGEHV